MRKIAGDVYQIPLFPRSGINCYIAEEVLIDSGIRTSYPKILKYVSEIPVQKHVLTHAHADHQGCSEQLCRTLQIPLLCHEKEVFRAESGLVTKDYPSDKSIIARLQQRFWAGKGCKVTGILKENDEVGNFTVIETPGHSDGHISLFREKDGMLIIGDVATNMNLLTTKVGLHLPPAIFTTDKEENIRSLQKLAALNPRIICFGHGPVLYNNNREFERFARKCT